MALYKFKMEILILVPLDESAFPDFDASNDIFSNLTGPWTRLQRCRKILSVYTLFAMIHLKS